MLSKFQSNSFANSVVQQSKKNERKIQTAQEGVTVARSKCVANNKKHGACHTTRETTSSVKWKQKETKQNPQFGKKQKKTKWQDKIVL